MFCSKCGRNNPDTASFCTGCGAPMQKKIEKAEVPNVSKPHIEPVVNSDPKVVSQSLSEANAALGNKNLSEKPKKSKKKKAIIIISVILSFLLVAGAVGLTIYLSETSSKRHWDKAIIKRDCDMIIDAYNETVEENDGNSYVANLWMCKVIRSAAQCVNNEFSYDDGNADVVNQVKALLNEQFGDLFYSKTSYGSYGYDDGIIFGMESFCDEEIVGGVSILANNENVYMSGMGQDYLNELVSLIESKAAYYNGLSYWNNEEYDKAIAEFLKVIPDDTLYEDAVEKTRTENPDEAESKGQASSSNEPKEPAKPVKDFTADMTAEAVALDVIKLTLEGNYDDAEKYYLIEEFAQYIDDDIYRSEFYGENIDSILELSNQSKYSAIAFDHYSTNEIKKDLSDDIKMSSDIYNEFISRRGYPLKKSTYDDIDFSKITDAYQVVYKITIEYEDGSLEEWYGVTTVLRYNDSWRCINTGISM